MFFENFKNKNLIAAHRGYRALYPENSMLAFKKSLKKCDFIEFDVQFTKDNIPVVIHDDKLKRTTDAKKHKNFKKPYNLYEYTYKELKQLDVSSWFYKKDPFSQKKKLKKPKTVQRIPTLKKVLKFAKKHDIYLNIEIKYNQLHILNIDHFKIIVDLIKEYKLEKKVLISSFEHPYLLLIKQLDNSLPTAALAHEKYPHDLVGYLKELEVEAYHINQRLATKKLVNQLVSEGFVVNVYTVNDKEKQKKLFSHGVRAIFTDFL